MFASKYAKMSTKELYRQTHSLSRRIARDRRYDYNAWERGMREWERIERFNPNITKAVLSVSVWVYREMFGHFQPVAQIARVEERE